MALYHVNHYKNSNPPRKYQFGSVHDDDGFEKRYVESSPRISNDYRDKSPPRYDHKNHTTHDHHDDGYGQNKYGYYHKEGHIRTYDHSPYDHHEFAKENPKHVERVNYPREEDHRAYRHKGVTTIDAEEAHRRYGGDYMKEYVGPIDSVEAARKYHGVIVPY